MAITRKNINKSSLYPTYNNLSYYFTSTNKAKKGFRYVAQVKDSLNNLLFEKTIIPMPSTGDCLLQMDKLMSDYVSYDFNPLNIHTSSYHPSKSYKDFKVVMGEEYFYEWDFVDYGYAHTDSTWWPNRNNPAHNPGLTNKSFIYNKTNVEPIYNIGDMINLSQHPDVIYMRPLMGSKKILDKIYVNATIPSLGHVGWVLVLDYPYIGDFPNNGGKTVYDDGRKSRILNLFTLDNQSVINARLSNSEYRTYYDERFIMHSQRTNTRALTTLPYDGYVARKDDVLFINYSTFKLPINLQPTHIVFENDTGDKSKLNITRAANRTLHTVNVGAGRNMWGTVEAGTLPIVKPNTKSYSFYFAVNTDTMISKKYTINIDSECNSRDSIKLIYQDKLGSFNSFNFDARNFENKTIKRDMYTQYLGGATSTGYNYELTDAGEKIYNQSIETSYQLNTGYLSSVMSEYFPEIVESPVTFLLINNEFVRCNMTTTGVEVKKDGWYEQKRYTVNIKLSNDERTNI